MMKDPILVVEDDTFLSKIIANRLREEGFEVESAENGAVALRMLRSQRFSLILLDILMPVMDGFDFLRKLKENGINTPVMVLTNLAQDLSMSMAKELGAESFYVKSNITIDEVARRIFSRLNNTGVGR